MPASKRELKIIDKFSEEISLNVFKIQMSKVRIISLELQYG